ELLPTARVPRPGLFSCLACDWGEHRALLRPKTPRVRQDAGHDKGPGCTPALMSQLLAAHSVRPLDHLGCTPLTVIRMTGRVAPRLRSRSAYAHQRSAFPRQGEAPHLERG